METERDIDILPAEVREFLVNSLKSHFVGNVIFFFFLEKKKIRE